ncbi:MAG: hypothetical protein IKJ31_02850 [Bacteroidaceae bacterium]|nr:hypothetical protein [Bacteroidaceae bacterium]
MREFLKTAILIVCVALCAQSVNAQRWARVNDTPVTVYSFTETVNTAPEVVQIFYNTQGEYFRDPRAPRFVLTDREGKWGLGIGGYVLARAEYDFDGIVDNIDFLPSDIQRDKGPSSQYQMDITTSTIFMKLVGRSRLLGDFFVYTAGDWRGSGKTFHLLHAYLSAKYITLGYTTGSFMDLAAYPATVDNAGPCGMTYYRATQLALKYSFDWGLSMGLGIESPDINASENDYVSVGAQRFPNIPIFVKYQFYKDTHVRVGGIVRDISYRNLLNNSERQKVGWGAQASTLVTIGNFQMSGQFTIGEGIGSLINDVSNIGTDIVPSPNEPGKMTMLLTNAWFASLQYNIAPGVFASATYSQSNISSSDSYGSANPNNYKRGQYLAVNMFANLSQNLQIGVEYLHGWRTDFNNDKFNANRINIMARYDF